MGNLRVDTRRNHLIVLTVVYVSKKYDASGVLHDVVSKPKKVGIFTNNIENIFEYESVGHQPSNFPKTSVLCKYRGYDGEETLNTFLVLEDIDTVAALINSIQGNGDVFNG